MKSVKEKPFDPRRVKDTLPKKPSALLRLALDDLAKVERDKRFVVNMNEWFKSNGHCQVCMAGSVMAKTLGVPIGERISTWENRTCNLDHFPVKVYNKFLALNEFRQYCFMYALEYLGVPDKKIKLACAALQALGMPRIEYEDDRTAFKRNMRRVASVLEKHGL